MFVAYTVHLCDFPSCLVARRRVGGYGRHVSDRHINDNAHHIYHLSNALLISFLSWGLEYEEATMSTPCADGQ